MERRINKQLEQYISTFKNNIKEKSEELGIKNEQMNHLIQYVFDYDRLTLSKDDFMKRKRVKNLVPHFDRCCAKRANGEQCTRRRKDDKGEYCGTHMKGTPHGIIDDQNEVKQTTQKIEVWAQDIQGIIYYIDKTGNVYQAEDIVNNKINPNIIAKYVKSGETFTIPAFGLL
jgi:hypothetical protein